MKQTLLIFIIGSLFGCGVKGAPAPRQDSTYIFRQDVKKVDLESDKTEKKKVKKNAN